MSVSLKKSQLTIDFNDVAYIKKDGCSEDCIVVDQQGGKHISSQPWKTLKENFQDQLVHLFAVNPESKGAEDYYGVDLLLPADIIKDVEIKSYPMSDPSLHVETANMKFTGYYDHYDYPKEIPEQLKKFAQPK